MFRRHLFATILAVAAMLAGLLMLTSQATAQPLTLIYSGNMDGELEPCGCSTGGDYGGIKRRATYLDQVRAEQPEIALISAGGLFSAELGGDRIKDSYILSGLAQLDYDAIGIQWADLLHGLEPLHKEALPLAAGNWKSDQLSQAQRFEANGVALYYTQWLNPETSPYQGMDSPIVSDPSAVIAGLKQARSENRLTILGTSLTLAQAEALFPLELVDILLIKAAYEQYGAPQQRASTLVLQPGSRGQRMGRLDLEVDTSGRINQWQHSVHELAPEVPDAPRMAAWYDAYNQALKDDYLWRVSMRKKIRSGESPYASEQVCATCHPAEHAKWQQTDHAQAFADLEEVNKAFDPNCLQCHTVGFMQPGGFLDLSLTRNLSNVQCENCHGAGAEHVASGGKTPPANADWKPEQICAQCHNHDHSPDFDFSRYWPKIQHP